MPKIGTPASASGAESDDADLREVQRSDHRERAKSALHLGDVGRDRFIAANDGKFPPRAGDREKIVAEDPIGDARVRREARDGEGFGEEAQRERMGRRGHDPRLHHGA
jgi:hypothetical protein